MIFKQWQKVLDGTKTQTRRPIKKGELFRFDNPPIHSWPFPPTVLHNMRLKWMVGKFYAVQPGRGKKAIGRIRLLAIHKEPLQYIDSQGCIAEGLSAYDDEGIPKTELDLIEEFEALWDNIYRTLPRMSWADNPEVWVLTLELVRSYV